MQFFGEGGIWRNSMMASPEGNAPRENHGSAPETYNCFYTDKQMRQKMLHITCKQIVIGDEEKKSLCQCFK